MAVKLTILLLALTNIIALTKGLTDLDFNPPWPNNELPKGCYRINGRVKCYRISHEKLANAREASESCQTQNGRLALPFDESLWTKIEEDVVSQSAASTKWLWLGGRVPARRDYIVDDDNQEIVLPDTSFWNNSNIGAHTNADRCLWASHESKTSWVWQLWSSCIDPNASGRYICEYTVSENMPKNISDIASKNTCSMDDLEINIPNANFYPTLTPEKTVEDNTTITIECWKGYQLSGNANITCTNSAWSHYPKCNPVCVLPEKSQHSSLIACENKTFYEPGEEVLFVCQNGYKSKADYSKTHFSLKCNEGGTWTSNSEEDCIPANEYEIVEIDITTRIHQRVRLNCGLERRSNTLITWHLNDMQLNSSGNYNILQSGALIINNLTESDHGMYFCIRQDSGIHEISTVYYELTRNTFITGGQTQTTKVIREGHSVILECQGRLFGKVKWTRSGHLIRHSRTHYVLPTGALFIQNAHFSDNGIYQCVRSHSGITEGSVVITHTLEIRDANDC